MSSACQGLLVMVVTKWSIVWPTAKLTHQNFVPKTCGLVLRWPQKTKLTTRPTLCQIMSYFLFFPVSSLFSSHTLPWYTSAFLLLSFSVDIPRITFHGHHHQHHQLHHHRHQEPLGSLCNGSTTPMSAALPFFFQPLKHYKDSLETQ